MQVYKFLILIFVRFILFFATEKKSLNMEVKKPGVGTVIEYFLLITYDCFKFELSKRYEIV